MALFKQILATSIANLLGAVMGVMFTWPSSVLTLFSAEGSPLMRPMSVTEGGLLGSLSSAGAILSTPLFGYLLDRFGRRFCMIASGLPYLISWVIVASSQRVEAVLVAMFISGVGGAAFLVAPVYISEICQESIRGAATASFIVSNLVGSLISYVLGGCLSYRCNVLVQLASAVLYCALSLLLRETPLHLLRIGDEQGAASAVAHYRGHREDSKLVLEEIQALRRALDASKETDDRTDEEHPLKPESKETTNVQSGSAATAWRLLLRSRSSRRALWLLLALVAGTVLMGPVVVQVYAAPMFEEILPEWPPYVSCAALALCSILASAAGGAFIDRSGRKTLLVGSCVSTGLCCACIAVQLQWGWLPAPVTVALLCVYCVTFSLGAGNVPYVLTTEMFLPEVKSLGSMLTFVWAWVVNFVVLLIFNPLAEAAGLFTVFYVFAAMSGAVALFALALVPETRGLAPDQVQRLLCPTPPKR